VSSLKMWQPWLNQENRDVVEAELEIDPSNDDQGFVFLLVDIVI
jgi:hypothetical protein